MSGIRVEDSAGGDLALLAVLTALFTSMWPISRWALRRNADPAMIGLWNSAVACALGLAAAVGTGHKLFSPAMALVGCINGVAYSVGFCLIIFRCLTIGPVGLTVALNNFGLLWPVVLGATVLSQGQHVTAGVLVGVVAVVAALGLLPWSRSDDGTRMPVSARWVRLAFIGWAMSGISFTCQFLAGRVLSANPHVYFSWLYGSSFVLLLAVAVWKRRLTPSNAELIAGAALGVIAALAMRPTIYLISRIPAAVFFPVTVAGPAVLMLIAGHFVLRERLNRFGWAVAGLGLVGVVLLSVSGNT